MSPRSRILRVIARIPRGRVATYGQIASLAGLPRRARLVGQVLSTLPDGSTYPWHRVINASGSISVRGGGEVTQRLRLIAEGVDVSPGGRVRMRTYRWTKGLERDK